MLLCSRLSTLAKLRIERCLSNLFLRDKSLQDQSEFLPTKIWSAGVEVTRETGDIIGIDAQVVANDNFESPKDGSEIEKELKELFSVPLMFNKFEFDEEDTIFPGLKSRKR
jgi:hypothetical protein